MQQVQQKQKQSQSFCNYKGRKVFSDSFNLVFNNLMSKGRSSYGPFSYISDTYFHFWQKCCLFCTEKTTFLPEMKISENYASGP